MSVVKGDWTDLMRRGMWESGWTIDGVMQGEEGRRKRWNDDGKGAG